MIWFLRHAEAVEGSPDSARELTEKGRRQSDIAGRALASLDVSFDLCLTSPKIRADQTARIACGHLGVEPVTENALEGGPFDAQELAAGLDSVLLVGHEPDFSAAVRDLTGGHVQMKKGGLAVVDGRTLVALLRPAQLRAIADSA